MFHSTMMIRWYLVNFVETYIEKWYYWHFKIVQILTGGHLGIIYSLIAPQAWEFVICIELLRQIKIMHEFLTLTFIAKISVTLYMENGGHLGFLDFHISPRPCLFLAVLWWFSRYSNRSNCCCPAGVTLSLPFGAEAHSGHVIPSWGLLWYVDV